MKYEFVTDGERLAYFLQERVLRNVPWNKLSSNLLNTGRGYELGSFFRELTTVNTACRIIAAGSSLLKETAECPARDATDPTYQKDFRDFLRERLLVSPPLADDLLRFAIRAVRASQEDLTVKERARHKRHARKRHPHCYMCGTALDFSERERYTTFTVEHIWPRRYGGNSVDDNLLPACGACNSHKKQDFATWAMANVQSLVLGLSPTIHERQLVEGTHRFALHYFAARSIATRKNTTLKQAFLVLKPWTEVRIRDDSDLGDFFNLANHRQLTAIE